MIMSFNQTHLFRFLIALPCAGLVFTSCKSSPKTGDKDQEDWDKANVVQVDPADSAYRQQLKNVQDSIGFFITLLKSKAENHFDFFAKAEFIDGDKAEHMWFSADSLVGNKIAGL
jgi:uncharacterized protein YegJ (DUF2314 family)